MRLENKVAIVSGGGTGIGAATARRFAAEGAKVVVTGRRKEPLDGVAAETGGSRVTARPRVGRQPAHVLQQRIAEIEAENRRLHDYFGRGENDVLHRLRAIRRAAVNNK